MEKQKLIRYISAPGKLDSYSYGTICFVHKNDEGTEQQLFVQTSKDEADPVWLSVEELALSAFGCYLTEPWFIEKLLGLYERKETIDKLLDLN